MNLELVLSLEVELQPEVIKQMRGKNLKVHGLEKLLRNLIFFFIIRRKNKYLWKKRKSLWMMELQPPVHSQSKKLVVTCHQLQHITELRHRIKL